MYGYIYLTTNNVNNMKYIGQHKASQFDEKYIGSGKLLMRAVKKYGKENFSCHILEPVNNVSTMCESREELNNSEKFYVDYYNCVDSDEYYNLMRGGNQGGFSPDVLDVMSKKASDRPHPPTTLGRIVVNNGKNNRCINPEELQSFLDKGFVVGKLPRENYTGWNNGHTAETDERVKNYTEKRNKQFIEKGHIGTYGLKGRENVNVKSDDYIYENIINKGFLEFWRTHPKTVTAKEFHMGLYTGTYYRTLELCGVSKEEILKHDKCFKPPY